MLGAAVLGAAVLGAAVLGAAVLGAAALGAAVLGAAALGAAVRVASARSVWLGDVVMATPIPGTYRLSDDTAFILAESAKHGICWAAKWPKPGLEQPGGFRHRRRALPAQYGRSGGLESAGRDYRCDCRTAAREG